MKSVIRDYTSKRRLGESGLKYIYTKADQPRDKIEDLKMLLAEDEPDVIMITEVIPKAQKNPISRENTKLISHSIRKAMDRKPFNFKEIDWENEFVERNHPEVEGDDETATTY